jgi:hypothetical protein
VCQPEDFKVGDPTDLGFDLGQGTATEIPPLKIEAGDQHGLRQASAFTDLPDGGTQEISRRLHVPNSELDLAPTKISVGSEFGADSVRVEMLQINAPPLLMTMFIRSLVYPSHVDVQPCSGGHRCPDILEMESGDYAVVGTDITERAKSALPIGSGCGSDERIVQVPREIMARAKPGIPEPT